MRLDLYLTKHHNIQSRNKAQELIKAKKIKINGNIIIKPSFKIDGEDINLEILEEEFYVSRSAKKLKYFLEEYPNIKIENKVALDIGSSTGGFTQILLKYNAKNITCVDVGSNQLHKTLKENQKLIICENTDIRKFKSNIKYDIITCDVSFISIHNILYAINHLANKDIIILFKPQFEVGQNVKRNRAGVVQDLKAISLARDEFIDACIGLKWNLIYSNTSQVIGKEGNIEELFYFSIDPKCRN